MEDALQALADMKAGDAPMEDREAKLVDTEAQLQRLLFNRATAAREGIINRPVRAISLLIFTLWKLSLDKS